MEVMSCSLLDVAVEVALLGARDRRGRNHPDSNEGGDDGRGGEAHGVSVYLRTE